LADELDNCKGKGNNYTEGHIQDVYKQEDIIIKEQDTCYKTKVWTNFGRVRVKI